MDGFCMRAGLLVLSHDKEAKCLQSERPLQFVNKRAKFIESFPSYCKYVVLEDWTQRIIFP